MRGTIIIPLTKSPHARGRIGPVALQDWFRGLRQAVSVSKLSSGAEIIVLSDVRVLGESHETRLYVDALTNLGMAGIRVICECYETIRQIDRSFELASQEEKDLVIVSTFLHYPRVQWLIWRHPMRAMVQVRHYGIFGIPRPFEALTDIVLAILFPFIDIFGGRQWFREAVSRRRFNGKL